MLTLNMLEMIICDVGYSARHSFKPSISACIAVKAKVKGKAKEARRGRIKSRHFDFLVIDTFASPLAALEFDGKHHQKKGFRKADRFKDELCSKVGLPLFRIKGSEFPKSAVAEAVNKMMDLKND